MPDHANFAAVIVLAWACSAVAQSLRPGDPAPPFSLKTLEQDFVYPCSDGSAVVIHAYDSVDAFSVFMWSSNFSVDSFLLDMLTVENSSVVLVGSLGGAGKSPQVSLEEVKLLRRRAVERTVALGWPPAQSQRVLSRIAFATAPVASWPSWIPATLAAWPKNVTTLAAAPVLPQPVTRLDGEYSVFPWPSEPTQGPETVADLGHGCKPAPGSQAAGGFALLSFDSDGNGYPLPPCNFSALTTRAQEANASAALLFPVQASQGARDGAERSAPPLAQPNCSTSDTEGACAAALSIPPTVISTSAGMALRAALGAPRYGKQPVAAALTHTPRPAMELLIYHDGSVQEAGWRKFASLRFLTWALEWAEYQQGLERNLTAMRQLPAVEVMENATVQGHVGAVFNATVPAFSPSADSLVVDFALGCPGELDGSCPVWDRVMTVTACCAPLDGVGAGQCSPFELARLITPFRRGPGRWLTDVSPLAPLVFPGGRHLPSRCRFQVQTDWWAAPWTATLSVRQAASPASEGVMGWGPSDAASFLFHGGSFDAQYNNRSAVSVKAPAGSKRAMLVAVITGHGYDSEGCAEFCPTEHVFEVGGTNVSVSFSDAGDFWGSTYSVAQGTIPNQHGTWQYGRDGWYDGNKVRQWRADVSNLAIPAGGAGVQVRYWGLFHGKDPAPTNKGAIIILNSWIAWYAS